VNSGRVIGFERQIGSDMSVQANYVYTGGRGEEVDTKINLSYNPVGLPIHRVDLRVQKSIAFSHRTLSGLVDVFNVFNRANCGSYTLTETSANYGKPSYNGNLAYQARMLQFDFGLAF
jgi:hypothetical protein